MNVTKQQLETLEHKFAEAVDYANDFAEQSNKIECDYWATVADTVGECLAVLYGCDVKFIHSGLRFKYDL